MESEILALHQALIDGHWNRDVDAILRDVAADFLSVANGEVRRPTLDEMRANLAGYLDNTTFSEYRDLSEPIVGFSEDGSLAWSVVQVKVAGRRRLDDGTERELDFVCAWLTLYRRQDGRWLRTAEVSTFK